jgi:pteridine reductase
MPTALVTGAGVRVGRAIALTLADAGYDLVLHVHASLAGAQENAAYARDLGRRAHVVQADLSTEKGVHALATAAATHAPTLDLVVHNAACFERVPFADITRAQHARMMAVNGDAPFFVTQALLPHLSSSTAPCIIFIGDIAGDRPMKGYAHYSVSKAGVLMLMRALAVELGPHIRVNAVSPGTVMFPEDFDDDARRGILARVPLAREGTAFDVARAVLFLAREPYLSGVNLPVDGGRAIAF